MKDKVFIYNNEIMKLNVAEKSLKSEKFKIIKFEERHFNSRLYLIFSKACNLNCYYCFQGNDSYDIKNNYKAQMNFEKYKNKLNEFEEVVIFGGEPLLIENMEIIKKAFHYCNVPITIFTNGNFEANWYETLILHKEKINKMIITLDGPERIHNLRRFNSKENSYRKIINNISFLKSNNINVIIQVNIDKNNIFYVEELINNILLFDCTIILNPVKYIYDPLNTEEVLKYYIKMKKNFTNSKLGLNNYTLHNLGMIINYGFYYVDRCRYFYQEVLDLNEEKIYYCPQNENLLLSNNITNNSCVLCQYHYLCSFRCLNENKPSECKRIIDKNIELILTNADLLF